MAHGGRGPATGTDYTPVLRVMADARKLGQPFDAAWPTALAAVRPDDRDALHATSEAWRCEYERRGSHGGDLLSTMSLVLGHDGRMTP